jgi:hypothetical protein
MLSTPYKGGRSVRTHCDKTRSHATLGVCTLKGVWARRSASEDNDGQGSQNQQAAAGDLQS